jgi:hypothetical protein
MASYYPGRDYVDWLGLSIYGKQFRDEGDWAHFRDLIDWPCKEISGVDPSKPVMIAEFGCGEFPSAGDKAQWMRDALKLIPRQSAVKAAVVWHERWQNEDGTFSNLRINSSPATLAAFREGLANPLWLGPPGSPVE